MTVQRLFRRPPPAEVLRSFRAWLRTQRGTGGAQLSRLRDLADPKELELLSVYPAPGEPTG